MDEVPPASQSLRYGNPAFRTWHARVVEAAQKLMRDVLPENRAVAAPELATYLADSFGNPTRIDYGTGHETTFVALLYCLVSIALEENHPGPEPCFTTVLRMESVLNMRPRTGSRCW